MQHNPIGVEGSRAIAGLLIKNLPNLEQVFFTGENGRTHVKFGKKVERKVEIGVKVGQIDKSESENVSMSIGDDD